MIEQRTYDPVFEQPRMRCWSDGTFSCRVIMHDVGESTSYVSPRAHTPTAAYNLMCWEIYGRLHGNIYWPAFERQFKKELGL